MRPQKAGKEILIIEDLKKYFREKVILNNISLNIYNGEKIRLNGKNGSRKININ